MPTIRTIVNRTDAIKATDSRHCERSEAIHDPKLHGSPRFARDDDHKSGFVYLASQSPRRRQLLEQLGVAYELLLPADDEDAEALEVVLPNEAPLRYVQRVTQLKLDAALQRLQDRKLPLAPVLCSDTTVALGRTILGKPADAADAERLLARLSGKSHRVLTAVALGTLQARQQAVSISRVSFAPMTPKQIRTYVATGEPMGKAGAYAVQGRAAAHIAHLSGSYSGIMGLPMYETAQLLRAFGFQI
jgi:septum formation protein